ncbi:dioxygenase [Sphingobium sp. MK2]|uniref:dioxygenase family protein n=1 Tax=Sphingobium sp. MK2 TaxID=3116540 RepID=UPI0032E363A5
MQDLNEDTLTQAVLNAVSKAGDPRVRQISQALVRHLHAFIKEIEPTEEEWDQAIAFLTKTGQMCSDTRQEFILFSDVLGVSMLVDMINHRLPGDATETTVFGPFYVEPPVFALGDNIRGHLEGTPLRIEGRVLDDNGGPIRGATVDLWHSDKDGFYDLQLLDASPGLAGRGRLTTDADGAFHCWTARPAPYPIPNDGPVGKMLEAQGRHPFRPEHVHFMIAAPGFRTLVTHIFAADGDYLDSDVVFGVKNSLIEPYGVDPQSDALTLQRDFVLARC